eukprot:scaffold350_cov333-Pavlova_lutheri.AAC.13
MQVALAQVVPYYVSFGPPKHRARTSGFRFRGAGAQFQCFPPIQCVLDPSAFFGSSFSVAGGAGGGFLLCMHLPYFCSSGVGPRVCGDVPCELLAIEQGIAKYTVRLFHVYPPGRLPVLDPICNAGEGLDGIHLVLHGVPSRPPGCLPPFHSVARGRGRSFSNLPVLVPPLGRGGVRFRMDLDAPVRPSRIRTPYPLPRRTVSDTVRWISLATCSTGSHPTEPTPASLLPPVSLGSEPGMPSFGDPSPPRGRRNSFGWGSVSPALGSPDQDHSFTNHRPRRHVHAEKEARKTPLRRRKGRTDVPAT